MSDGKFSMLPDYPQVERIDPEPHYNENLQCGQRRWLIHTRIQAEAGKIKAPSTRIPHEGKVT